ncbi:4091_t:CDS:2 [Acaulospora morrowiae]|uniref:4091_t:CDS:1 n=1 Tax=Acaulospora morrowiae TaxID=94023 RepID=A0A9N9A816_9GLOM|nr:4091_t:CDS:2 [Acaulospora morrowiae]
MDKINLDDPPTKSTSYTHSLNSPQLTPGTPKETHFNHEYIISSLREVNDTYRNLNNDLNRTVLQLQSQIVAAEKEKRIQSLELHKANITMEIFKKEKDSLKEKVETLTNEIKSVKNRNDFLTKEVEKLQDHIEQLISANATDDNSLDDFDHTIKIFHYLKNTPCLKFF